MDRKNLNNILKWAAIVIIVITVIFICGWIGTQYTRTIGRAQTEAEREVFKETTAYNESAAAFLADSYRQYQNAETEADRHAIMEYVIMRYPNLDSRNIENRTLRQFYENCLGQERGAA